MNKELTPLEALEKLRQNNVDDSHLFDDELLDIIETALNELKIMKEIIADILTREEEDKLKALEIIKEKTKYFVEFDNNTKTIYIDSALDCDNEEYDLLKEVFDND